jgi:putative transposase
MNAEPRYRINPGADFSLKYHLVWRPKYRRKVLTSPVDKRLKELIVETAEQHGVTVLSMEVMSDHVRLFVEAGPTLSVAEIVNRIKGRSSRVLRQEFTSLRSRLPTLWSRSYYAGSIGAASESVVRRYIEAQKGV